MNYHIAQINIARFRLPADHPDNRDFVENLGNVNAVAEAQPGFIWRLTRDGNDALDLKAYDDPNIAINLTVWSDLEALTDFVYRNSSHLAIMRRRKEWFDKFDVYMALWWNPVGLRPTIQEGKSKLELLRSLGPTPDAFTFREPFPAPSCRPKDSAH